MMVGRVYDFNLLVSCSWRGHGPAKSEVQSLLARFGDPRASVRRTLALGILGVTTSLDAREVIARLRALHAADPLAFQHTCIWVPIDLWTTSEIDAMRGAVLQLRDRIAPGHTWRMTVKKRRYTRHHTIDVIRALADLVPGRVDLRHPDRILRIDILGNYAGLAVLTAEEIFSTGLPP